jgi:uncharacterized DUF497 family protein
MRPKHIDALLNCSDAQRVVADESARPLLWYNCYTVRIEFDVRKSRRLRANPKRRIGFEEAQEVFSQPYYLDQRSDLPEQYRAIGWVRGQLYSVIFEVREDKEWEYYRLVTLWKATKQEQRLYEENS